MDNSVDGPVFLVTPPPSGDRVQYFWYTPLAYGFHLPRFLVQPRASLVPRNLVADRKLRKDPSPGAEVGLARAPFFDRWGPIYKPLLWWDWDKEYPVDGLRQLGLWWME